MPKCGNSGTDPPKIKNFKLFCYQWKRLTNKLQTSNQPLLGDNVKPRCDKKYVLGHKCPNMVIQAKKPRKLNFLNVFAIV